MKNEPKHYTVKQIYKKEQVYNKMKKNDTKESLSNKTLNIIRLYAITALTYPIMGIGAVTDMPLWITLSPLVINAVPYALGVRLLFFKKRLYDLENKLSSIYNNMSEEEKKKLEELTINNDIKQKQKEIKRIRTKQR